MNTCNHGWVSQGGTCSVCENKSAREDIKQDFVELIIKDNEELRKELKKHKVVIKYFMENGKQETKDIIKNLLSY